MTNSFLRLADFAKLAEVDRLLRIATGELVLVTGRIRMEHTGQETPVQFTLPSKHAPRAPA